MNLADVFAKDIFWGSHGRSGIERLFMDSSTERVIGHAEKKS
jgi:nucleotide-binding universal stress UspA family protein